MEIKNYSLIENIAFVNNIILNKEKYKYNLLRFITIFFNIVTDIMLVFLPAFTIDLLTDASDIKNIIFKFTLYFLTIYTIKIFNNMLNENIENVIDKNRMRKGSDYYDNIMKIDYENLEVSKDILYAGLDSYMDGYHRGYSHMLIDCKNLIQSILSLIVYSIFISRISIWMSIFLLIIGVISYKLNTLKNNWVKDNQKNWLELDQKLNYLSIEATSLKNAKDIRVFNMKNWIIDSYNDIYIKRKDWIKKGFTVQLVIDISVNLLKFIKYGIIYFILFNKIKEGIGVSEFVLSLGLIMGISSSMDMVFDNLNFLASNNILVNNTRTALEIDNTENANISNEDIISETYDIELKDISYIFPETNKKIFDNFNLHIKKGEKLAIVGINGAGKTTLIKLITGLYKPSSGEVLLNGKNISKIKKEDVFKKYATVFQDFNVLAMSITENISCVDKEISDEDKVLESLKLAGLKDKVKSLKNNINSNMTKELDKDGIVFSGGETQKLMLSRCLYKDGSIIILDEPTAALDALAEKEIYEKYNSLVKNKTSIFISHRLSSTKFCDRIIVLDNGVIIEEGTHEELLNNNGEYTKMYNIQASYYMEGEEDIA